MSTRMLMIWSAVYCTMLVVVEVAWTLFVVGLAVYCFILLTGGA